MNALVSQFAVPVGPLPVPVVVEMWSGQRCGGRWPEPEIIVDVLRDGINSRWSNRWTLFVADGAGVIDATDPPATHEFHGFDHTRIRARLHSRLADALVVPSGLHQATAFPDVVTDRLLDVDIFTRLHRPDGGQRVPMMGRRDADNVHTRDRRTRDACRRPAPEAQPPCRLTTCATRDDPTW